MKSYEWINGTFAPCSPASSRVAGPFDRVDSWRHRDGRANGLTHHLERFGGVPDGFVQAMLPLISAGDLFPRIARCGSRLFLDVRPAPAPRTTTVLTYTPTAPDPRTQPLLKGPDLDALAQYRDSHQLPGTDDTVIVGAEGGMLETTTGALLAWDGDTLVLPSGTWLPSVTSAQIVDRARAIGLSVSSRPLYPDDNMPLWFANSLHGISPVTEIRGQHAKTPPAHPRTVEWQAWWWGNFAKSA
ncbi:aminotransferase [Corynebacterium genitalium ATCC 33030]|uniref:Aminotransferase, class IV n=1 Tax=Corynebacterium genitalium ATCC 33030 TaxID=585529 RepID=D7WEY2_9CORY|nr:aminotransferase [Corynebacterium genitalium]EFK53663.1 hypothetical protein HMPREF0291_11320 [Corynebacterium genitalium ATCC 33030]UUA88763.1 aminotransferase [Corynebacterium genitalium ATCC 33030]